MDSGEKLVQAIGERLTSFDAARTSAHRVIHGAAEGWPDWYVDRYGGWLLSQSEADLGGAKRRLLEDAVRQNASLRGVYHKQLDRQVRTKTPEDASPVLVTGESAPEAFEAQELGVRYEIRFGEGYSVGLFLDQRDNRGRLLGRGKSGAWDLGQLLSGRAEILNTFAYTCAFSVCAALAGARATSLDLSRKYLDWGRRNFALNGLDPDEHDFIYGDAFDWMKRLANKGRRFDLVILDPPTFSKSRKRGVFQTAKDFGELTALALRLLKPRGVLLASCNTARLQASRFDDMVRGAVAAEGRRVIAAESPSQPRDFPVSRAAPAYLKQLWLRVS